MNPGIMILCAFFGHLDRTHIILEHCGHGRAWHCVRSPDTLDAPHGPVHQYLLQKKKPGSENNEFPLILIDFTQFPLLFNGFHGFTLIYIGFWWYLQIFTGEHAALGAYIGRVKDAWWWNTCASMSIVFQDDVRPVQEVRGMHTRVLIPATSDFPRIH